MVVSCIICNRAPSKRSPGVNCGKCSFFYHNLCAKVDENLFNFIQSGCVIWRCENCRSGETNSSIMSEDSDRVNCMSNSDISWISAFKKEILLEINNKFDAILTSVNFCSNKISDFETNLEIINEKVKIINKLEQENTGLRSKIVDLDKRMNDMEQYSKLNNLLIHNCPEVRNEDTFDLLYKIGDNLGIQLEARDIDAAHRLQPNSDSGNKKPRNIVVKFISRHTKDKILTAFKRNKNLSSNQINIDGQDQPIYISEHLSSVNSKLFKDSREILRQKGYKYIWTKNAKIFARQDDTSRIRLIQRFEDIEKLC